MAGYTTVITNIIDIIIWIVTCIYYLIERVLELLFPPPKKSLKGEVILITGAANGIGKQMCLYMADLGATLVCWDINKEENDKIVLELQRMGSKAVGYHVDVSDRMEVEKACLAIKSQLGDVTIIINNAAIMPCVKFLDQSWKSLDQTFKVNVISHFWIIKEFLPSMIENKRGHIVTMCSIVGYIGAHNFVSYSSTKHAVQGYMDALGEELKHHPEKPDIKLTTVYPSQVNTSMAQNNVVSRFQSVMPRLLEPEYVAKCIVDGMRRNSTYIHLPFMSYVIGTFSTLVNPKIKWASKKLLGIDIAPPSITTS